MEVTDQQLQELLQSHSSRMKALREKSLDRNNRLRTAVANRNWGVLGAIRDEILAEEELKQEEGGIL